MVKVAEVPAVAASARDHLVDGSPVGEAAHVAVVDVAIGVYFAWAGAGCGHGIGGVHGMEFKAARAAPFHGFVEFAALAVGPEYEDVAVVAELFEGVDGERDLSSYAGVFVLDDRAVEVNG